ncbi:MAG: cupin [Saprospiraceae bacterium]|nr:cupin [Saprospiraceae bacterium]
MDSQEVEKSKAFITVEIIEYVPNSVVIKTVLKKSTGNITVMSVDSGEGLTEKTSPFDTFAQVIDGQAEIVINGLSNLLKTGQSIVIPRPPGRNFFRRSQQKTGGGPGTQKGSPRGTFPFNLYLNPPPSPPH